MEKSLRGAAAPSLLPARTGLGTASIDPIAARWDQQQGGSGGDRPCHKEASSACGSVGSRSGMGSQDLLSVPSCCVVPGSCHGPLCAMEEGTWCSRCCRVIPLFLPSSPQKHHPLSPLKHPLRPQPQIPPRASPATSPLCNSCGAATAARGRGINKSMAIKIPRCNHN